MFETITKFAGYLEHVTFFTYPVTIFLGFLSGMAAITCCLPLVPAIAGFVGTQGSNRRRLIIVPLFMMLGAIVILVLLGLVASFAGLAIQQSLGKYWAYFIGLVCIMVGLFVLGIIRIPTRVKIPKIKQAGFIGSFIFGICMGGVIGIGSSCCFPALPIVLTYAAIQGRPVHGALIMACFAIGQSIPLFAISLFSNVVGKFTGRWSALVRRIAGFLLLCSGIYFIWKG